MATKRTKTATAMTMTTSPHLPIDVVSDILSRLPSKSLLRFRCVCKSWRDLITDPKFIECHRNQNNTDHMLSIDLQHLGSRWGFNLRCNRTFMVHTRLEFPFMKFFASWCTHVINVEGCSNGLVLIHIYGVAVKFSEIILWNPSIRKWKVLPHSGVAGNVFALDFIPQINDYKVLRIENCPNGTRSNYVAKPEIYSLSSNSWKPIENIVGCFVFDSRLTRVVNGVVLFMAKDWDAKAKYMFILKFDMVSEVFTKIKIPKLSNIIIYPMMSGSGEEVVLFGTHFDDGAAHIWAMKENWYSLTRVFTTDKHVEVEPLGFLKNGELVLKYIQDRGSMHGILDYDPRLRKVKEVITNLPLMVCKLFHYTESLILLDEGD